MKAPVGTPFMQTVKETKASGFYKGLSGGIYRQIVYATVRLGLLRTVQGYHHPRQSESNHCRASGCRCGGGCLREPSHIAYRSLSCPPDFLE